MSEPGRDQRPPTRYSVDTVEQVSQRESFAGFFADGRRIGHGTRVWLWAPEYAMPAKPDWRSLADPPVVVMLDTELRDHAWLREPDGEPFQVDPCQHGWPRSPSSSEADGSGEMKFGKYWGHATFLAGIIRRTAPGVRLLVLPVMDQQGKVDETKLITALDWLPTYVRQPGRKVVVLMAFGGEFDPVDPSDCAGLAAIRKRFAVLAELKVPVVVSAGNHGSERPRYPAAFATDPGLAPYVVSVGARTSPTERAPFSNVGVWVREWREATDVVSLMPLAPKEPAGIDTSNYAWWSGTSFAAAAYAAERANHLMDAPPPTGGPEHG